MSESRQDEGREQEEHGARGGTQQRNDTSTVTVRSVSTQTEDQQLSPNPNMNVYAREAYIWNSRIRSVSSHPTDAQPPHLGDTGGLDNEYRGILAEAFEDYSVRNASEQASPRFPTTEDAVTEEDEELIRKAVAAHIQDDPSRKSTALFMKLFEEERAAAQLIFEGRRDLVELFEKLWNDFCFKVIAEACDNETRSPLDQLFGKMSLQILQKKPSQSVLANFLRRADDFVCMGRDLASNSCLIHALHSYHIAAKLHKLASNGDDSVCGINSCSQQMYLLAEKIATQDAILVKNHVIPKLQEVTEYIRAIEGATRPVKVDKEAWCRSRVALCFYLLKEFKTFAKENETAIEFVKSEFRNEAKNYRVYGRCLHNAGVAYERMERISKALEYCNTAFEAYEKARDWESEQQKNKYLSMVRHLRTRCENVRPLVPVC